MKMMGDIFPDLRIDGAFISEVIIAPLKMIRMRLFHGPRSDEERLIAEEYELVISNLRHFTFSVQAIPWLEISSHEVSTESDYLTNYLTSPQGNKDAERAVSETSLRHYRFVCVEGSIDIIGGQFICYLINEMPFFKSA